MCVEVIKCSENVTRSEAKLNLSSIIELLIWHACAGLPNQFIRHVCAGSLNYVDASFHAQHGMQLNNCDTKCYTMLGRVEKLSDLGVG